MRVLIVKNAREEGPGALAKFLGGKGIEFLEIEAYLENWKIEMVNPYDFLVVLGGPMGVYEIDKYRYLAKVARAIEVFLEKGKKVLGICLGAQLLAHVLGSRVYNSGKEEIGWCEIEMTEEGLMDPCFRAFTDGKRKVEVFQWHNDTFELPRGAKRLATSLDFENQAFFYNGSYGIQFHPEVTRSMIVEWFVGRENFSDLVRKTDLVYESYRKSALRFFERFFLESKDKEGDHGET